MIPDSKLQEIAEALLSKSRAGKVEWMRAAAASADNKESYVIHLANSAIILRYFSPPAEDDFIRLELMNEKPEKVATWGAQEDHGSRWQTMEELLWEARRCLMHWDKVLTEVTDFLGVQPEPAGTAKR